MNNEDIELITLYNTLKEEFLYDRENSSFSFNITWCLSRPFNRFTKDFLKCSRTNKKLFAKNFDFVREQFGDCSRTLKCFDAITTKYTLEPTGKRKYHRSSTMSKAEVMLIMILFHDSGYRCLKHFYLEKVYSEPLPPIACFQRNHVLMYKEPLKHSLHVLNSSNPRCLQSIHLRERTNFTMSVDTLQVLRNILQDLGERVSMASYIDNILREYLKEHKERTQT